MPRSLLLTCWLACMSVDSGPRAAGAESFPDPLPLAAGTQVRLAPVTEGRAVLGREDRFVRALSPWDRQARLRTDREVSTAEFLGFVAGEVVPWEAGAQRKVAEALTGVRERLRGWSLPLPETILLVLTTGKEEGGAAYCRERAIVLPQPDVARRPGPALEQLLLHELFHLVSAADADLRDRLYASIGFRRLGPVTLPPDLAARRITNPDAPVVEHAIDVASEDGPLTVMPLLYTDAVPYPVGDGRPFFAFLQFRLLAVEKSPGGTVVPVRRDGQLVLLDPAKVPSYHDQIGRNTGYIIHPEEVLADNFAMLMLGRTSVKSPHVLAGLRRLLPAANAR